MMLTDISKTPKQLKIIKNQQLDAPKVKRVFNARSKSYSSFDQKVPKNLLNETKKSEISLLDLLNDSSDNFMQKKKILQSLDSSRNTA